MEHTIRINGEQREGIKLAEPYGRKLAIKLMCTECMGYEGSPAKDCTSKLCPLFPFRGRTQVGRVTSKNSNLNGLEAIDSKKTAPDTTKPQTATVEP